MTAGRLALLLAIHILVPAALSASSAFTNALEIGPDNVEGDHSPFSHQIINEDIEYLNNLMDEWTKYITNIKPRLGTDFNAPQDQETYKMWKRNANIINTLLGFPRRMLMAGR